MIISNKKGCLVISYIDKVNVNIKAKDPLPLQGQRQNPSLFRRVIIHSPTGMW